HAQRMLESLGVDQGVLRTGLENFLGEALERLPAGANRTPEETPGVQRVLQRAAFPAISAERSQIDAPSIVIAMMREPSCQAVYLLEQQGVTRLDALRYVSHSEGGVGGVASEESEASSEDGAGDQPEETGAGEEEGGSVKDPLGSFTTDLVAKAAAGRIDPLVGRAAELERSIHVLARRRKNNPVFVGEPGVGKTAIVEGLARAIH
ncbi:MAG: ATP-dependent Clp protease ATP-binding subunit ClpA, partial [Alphaproteobacteria bacterium]